MKAYVAVQRKLLALLYILWKKNEMYNPDKVVKEKILRKLGDGAFFRFGPIRPK